MGRVPHSALKPRENAIQSAVVDHWRVLGRLDTMVAAIPNARAFGQAGLTRGLPDLVVLAPGLPVGFIELKRDARSQFTDEQRLFKRLCDTLGVKHALAIGRDAPVRVLEDWGVVREAAA